ncbi:hypothetical protein ACFSC4_17245 [Deinococcus malanensis]|nr:hypothetical protein [Deinococcus malanensis]
MEFQEQVRAAGFPDGMEVTRREDDDNRIFRVLQGAYGVELVLTAEACRMYGEGPSTALALTELRKAVDAGLPQVHLDGTLERLTLVGD